MLTYDELQAMRARCEAATPGPWANTDNVREMFGSEPIDWWKVYAKNEKGYDWPMVICGMSQRATDEEQNTAREAYCSGLQMCDPGQAGRDANFIAHARTDIPAMLAHIEHQRRALEWLTKQAAYICRHATGCPVPYQACPNGNTRCLDIEAEHWMKKSLDATKETDNDKK